MERQDMVRFFAVAVGSERGDTEGIYCVVMVSHKDRLEGLGGEGTDADYLATNGEKRKQKTAATKRIRRCCVEEE